MRIISRHSALGSFGHSKLTTAYKLICFCMLFLVCLSVSTPVAAQRRKTATTQKSSAKKTTAKKVDKKTQLRNAKKEAERKRKLEQERAKQLAKNIKANLDSVLVINGKMNRQQRSIDSLSVEIKTLQANIDSMSAELSRLEAQLELRRKQYARSLMQQRKQQTVQQRLTFIFSADNFAQILRRMRYIREYTTYQRAQGELIQEKQLEVNNARNKLLGAQAAMKMNLGTMESHQKQLARLKSNCESKATLLNKNLDLVNKQIAEYQKREQQLSNQIEKLIQEEIEAERRRRAEAERRRQEEEARRAAQAANNTKTSKKSSKSSSSSSSTADKGTKVEKFRYSEYNDKLSSSFTANKGRLPMPITGGFNITCHFGMYNVQGLRNVTLNSKGIDIRGQQGAMARAIFDGEVSSIFQYGSTYIVMLRHGSYISVYSGLKSVSVRKGQKVKTKDTLGVIGTDPDEHYTLHFQLRRESTLLNPEHWVR